MKRSKGFTLIELLVVVAIIALLVSILLPTLGRARELTKQALCSANLNGIGKAWVLYGNDANDQPPIMPDIQPDVGGDWNAALKAGNDYTSAQMSTAAQNNLALLVKQNIIGWEIFLCPSVGTTKLNRAGTVGFIEPTTNKIGIDYGLQVPYAKNGAATNSAALSGNMTPSMVIVGDRGPNSNQIAVAGDPKQKWSPNHPDDGESVLSASWAVRFSKDKVATNANPPVITSYNTGGYDSNNIYTLDTWTLNVNSNLPQFAGYGGGTGTPGVNAQFDTVLISYK